MTTLQETQRCIYVVSGIPGAGKTTVSRALARRFDRGVHIESDLLQLLILSGGLWPQEQPEEEATRQLALRTRNACSLARSFFDAGFTVVIDDVVLGRRLAEFQKELQGYPIDFVMLLPDIDIVQKRDAARPEKHVFDLWSHLDAVARNETPRIGLWLDTSTMTVDETVDLILARESGESAEAH